MMPHRSQEKDSNSGVNLVWNLGVVDPCKKNFDFHRHISEKFHFFQAILQKNIEFCRQISENYISNEVLKLAEVERYLLLLLTIIRTRQRNWMRHIREIIKGRMDCKWGRRRPRKKLLAWMMSEEYSKLKEEAQHRETWNHWRSGPARGQRS